MSYLSECKRGRDTKYKEIVRITKFSEIVETAKSTYKCLINLPQPVTLGSGCRLMVTCLALR